MPFLFLCCHIAKDDFNVNVCFHSLNLPLAGERRQFLPSNTLTTFALKVFFPILTVPLSLTGSTIINAAICDDLSVSFADLHIHSS